MVLCCINTAHAACRVQDVLVGAACWQNRHSLEVSYPITNGIVKHWEDMYQVWDHTFKEQLSVDPTECKILLTDPPLNPKANREQLFETMFEHYGFQGTFIQIQAVLTLYAQGTAAACATAMLLAARDTGEQMLIKVAQAQHLHPVYDCSTACLIPHTYFPRFSFFPNCSCVRLQLRNPAPALHQTSSCAYHS